MPLIRLVLKKMKALKPSAPDAPCLCARLQPWTGARKTNPMDAFVDDNPLKSKGFGTKAQWNVLDEEADSRQEEDEEEELEEMTPTTPVPG